MTPHTRKIDPQEVPPFSETMASAFLDDPALGWCYVDRERRKAIYPSFFGVIARAYFAQGEIFTAGQFDAGAACLPPDARVDKEKLALLDGISAEYVDRLSTMAALTRESHPRTPHYFIAFIGTRAESQGRGIGTALLRHLLARNDHKGLASYLEATTSLNRELYAEHGFETIGQIDLPAGPSMWQMWREPHAPG